MVFDLSRIARPNILTLEPYRCARDDFKEGILLDANENTHGPAAKLNATEEALELNRYPDPHQIELKQQICDFRNTEAETGSAVVKIPEVDGTAKKLKPANLCLGVGSDESIDALLRCFCVPGKEKLLVCPPTYGMYGICATVNDVEIVKVPLKLDTFQIDSEMILGTVLNDPSIKLIYLTTPGNPTAAQLDVSVFVSLLELLESNSWNGLIVADEAYVDFSPIGSSLAPLVNKFPRLVVLQTLSKSFGLAGIRLGITYSCPEVSLLLNSMKYPYNISNLTSDVAIRATSPGGIAKMRANCDIIVQQRGVLLERLLALEGIGKNRGGLDANFLMVEILNKDGVPDNEVANEVYNYLATNRQVVVRFRGKELGCTGCLRVTVGTKEENETLVEEFQKALPKFR